MQNQNRKNLQGKESRKVLGIFYRILGNFENFGKRVINIENIKLEKIEDE